MAGVEPALWAVKWIFFCCRCLWKNAYPTPSTSRIKIIISAKSDPFAARFCWLALLPYVLVVVVVVIVVVPVTVAVVVAVLVGDA